MDNAKWDRRFLDLAAHYASWSKDPGTQVGAVIADGKFQVSQGYNGLPQKAFDRDSWLHNRDLKIQLTIHAEANAILLARCDLTGYTMYSWPIPPCAACAAWIIQCGIIRVVSEKYEGPWEASVRLGEDLFQSAGVKVVRI